MKQNIIESWLAEVSPSTAIVYLSCIRGLARFLGVADAAAAVEALIAAGENGASEHLGSWRALRVSSGCSPATVACGISAVRSVLRFAKRVGRITWVVHLDSMRVAAVEDRSGPTVESVRKIMRAARLHDNQRVAARDAALVALLAGCGLRRSEALALDIEHVEAGAVAILATCKGKRGRDRIRLPAAVCKALAAWIEQHPRREEPSAPLFCALNRGAAARGFARMTGEAVRLIVARAGELAGIETRVRPHGLRHAFTTAALDVSRGASYRVAVLTRHRSDKGVHHYDNKKRAKTVERQPRLADRVACRILGGDQ